MTSSVDPARGGRRPRKASVLVVDDAPAFRVAVRELLARRGYDVAGEADSIATALDLVERLAPDAILLDLHLPDGDCFKLASRLRTSHPGVAILLTSAEFQISFYARADACGARGFVPKNQLGHVNLARFWPDIGPEAQAEPT